MKKKWFDKRKMAFIMGMAGLMVCMAPGSVYGQNQTEADNESQVTMYGIGSTSKIIVTAAVMKLEEEGKVDLDSPLTDYIPEFSMADQRYKKITPRMLLDHTSGIQGSTLTNAMLMGDSDTDNHDHLLTRLRSQRLKAEPGAFGTYCNDGFTLAEILVERVTGLSFTDYLQQEMTGPLGLSWIKTPQSPSVKKDLAPVYDKQSAQELPPEAANVIGSGGIYGTAEDLVRLADIFTRDQKGSKGIIAPETAEKMEDSVYARHFNPEGRDSNLTYGLGWDSVDTYPFNRYGVKALVKGGDTNFYHSSLTVLPEENIACAVLTSGGSSSYNQLAVQEILLTYLDEIERIERDEEEESKELAGGSTVFRLAGGNDNAVDSTQNSTQSNTQNSTPLEGWYAGNKLMHVSMRQPGFMKLEIEENGHQRLQTYEATEHGRYVSAGGNYIDGTGGFSKGSNGRIGRTYLEVQADEQGNNYLMAGIYEKYPRLGTLASYIPIGEQITTQEPSLEALESWRSYDNKKFYLVSDKYTSGAYLTRFRVKTQLSEPAGYLTFENGDLSMAQITALGETRFFQQVPGQAGRDLDDYKIQQKDGKTYLVTSSFRFIEESNIDQLPKKSANIVIGSTGESVWYSLNEQQTGSPVTIKVPSEGAFYVYDETGREAAAVINSWIMKAGESLILPKKGKIVFAGSPGTSFALDYLN